MNQVLENFLTPPDDPSTMSLEGLEAERNRLWAIRTATDEAIAALRPHIDAALQTAQATAAAAADPRLTQEVKN